MNTIKRRSAIVVAALVAGGSLFLGPAAGATTYLQSGVAIRSTPYTNSTVYGRGYPGQNVVGHYQNTGSTYSYSNSTWGSGSSNSWEYHTNTTTGVTGWSGSFFLGN